MILVTGGAGFIGSNVVAALNRAGCDDILIVDNLERGEKYRNLRGLRFRDVVDKRDFRAQLAEKGLHRWEIRAVLHQGACSDTMEWNGRYMLENNLEVSKELLAAALKAEIPFIYASSASVYGRGKAGFREDAPEYPLNVYAWSKQLFDQHVRRALPGARSQVVGLRYFNVFGPQEMHKGRMASMVYRTYCQLRDEGVVRLFEGTDGFGPGEQRRDFIHVEDVARVNLFFLDTPGASGIFNCGTGEARSFNDVARLIMGRIEGRIEYVPFPPELQETYQSYTEADLVALRAAGFDASFLSLEEGVGRYLDCLLASKGYLSPEPENPVGQGFSK